MIVQVGECMHVFTWKFVSYIALAQPLHAIGPLPKQRRAATSKKPTTCTLPSDVITHNLVHHSRIRRPKFKLPKIFISVHTGF